MDSLFYNKETKYTPLGDDNASTDSIGQDDEYKTHFSTVQQSRLRVVWLQLSMVFNAILLATCCVLGFLYYQSISGLNPELRNCSTYSPIYDQIDLEFQTKLLNGTFYPKKNEPSIARQRPSPQADAVWDEWGTTRILPLTRNDIIKMGKDPSVVAKLEDKEFGLGDDAYAGTLDIFHQLHCVDTLRRIAYGSYYNKTTIKMDTENQTEVEMHMNHCVDMLMQTIQCTGNLNVITMNWVELGEFPFPDMSVNRKCINFDKLTDWRKANTVDMDYYVQVMEHAPDGQTRAPMADAYYEAEGLPNPNHLNGANPGIEFNI